MFSSCLADFWVTVLILRGPGAKFEREILKLWSQNNMAQHYNFYLKNHITLKCRRESFKAAFAQWRVKGLKTAG